MSACRLTCRHGRIGEGVHHAGDIDQALGSGLDLLADDQGGTVRAVRLFAGVDHDLGLLGTAPHSGH